MERTTTETGWHDVARRAQEAARVWAAAGLARRLEVLQAIGAHVQAHVADLERAYREMGFSKAVAANMTHLQGGVPYFTNPPRLARYAGELMRPVRTADGGVDLLVRRPDGVVLMLLATHVAMMPLVDVLLPGNAVVLRTRTLDPVTAWLTGIVHRVLRENGFPEALVSFVSGGSKEITDALLPSPSIDTVIFFGTYEIGQRLAEQGIRLGKKVVLQGEGSDSMLVWRDADLDQAVESACSAWLLSSQMRVTPRRALVHASVADELLARLIARTPAHATSMETDPENGHLVPVARIDDLDSLLDELRAAGATIVHGGYRMDAHGAPDTRGRYVAPTIVSCDSEIVRGRRLRSFTEECPLPIFPVIRFEGDDSTISRAMTTFVRAIPFGLRVSVWCREADAAAFFAEALAHCGLLLFNEHHMRPPQWGSPSGGPGRSGGPRGESTFFWEHTSRLQSIRLADMSEESVAQLLARLGVVSPLRSLTS